jgi:DNA-binding response OmpR family regulator
VSAEPKDQTASRPLPPMPAAREAIARPARPDRSADDPTAPPRILIVSQIKTERDRLRARLSGLTERFALTECGESGLAALRAMPFDLALVRNDLPGGTGVEWARRAAAEHPALATIIIEDDPSLDDAVEAMRAGAADLITPSATPAELIARVQGAVRRSRAVRARERRIDRLKHACRQLNSARQEVTRQVGSLCNDLVSAYQELSDQMSQVSIATEFASVIKAELDVEGLLRAGLEYILTRVGPTNAAVFLPSSSRDYSLGAYVNYSCPKDSADVLLDNLANTVAPKLEERDDILLLADSDDVSAFLGADATWLTDSTATAFACRHDNECLAVVILFRDEHTPFEESLLPMLRTIADLFAHQLARVIHIHHRHLPKDQWGSFDQLEGGDDDLDLAA